MDVARRLDVPQHRLIHLCEKGVVVPDVHEATGRGSSRVFSTRNFFELAVALRLRDIMLPVAAVGAILHVLRAFEDRLQKDLTGFTLTNSLREDRAPDLRIIISDGRAIYFSLGATSQEPKLFGGIPLDELTNDKSIWDGRIAVVRRKASDVPVAGSFGGPEQSRFVRLELSLTEVARALPLD